MFQVKQECIVIEIPMSNEYNIPLNGCDNYEKILGWTIHLSEKSWVTKDIIYKFMETALKENGLTRPVV